MRRRRSGVDVRTALAAADRDLVDRLAPVFLAAYPSLLTRAEAIDAGHPVDAHGWEIDAPNVNGRYRLHPDGSVEEL